MKKGLTIFAILAAIGAAAVAFFAIKKKRDDEFYDCDFEDDDLFCDDDCDCCDCCDCLDECDCEDCDCDCDDIVDEIIEEVVSEEEAAE